jgi:hypothetical protein
VALTCSVLPSLPLAPQCSITPNSVNSGTPATLTVTTTVPSLATHRSWRVEVVYAAWLPAFGLTLLGAGLTRRTKKSALPAFLFCCWLMTNSALLVGCGSTNNNGGSRGSPGTPPGTYTITVNATSGSLVHSATVTLKVQ